MKFFIFLFGIEIILLFSLCFVSCTKKTIGRTYESYDGSSSNSANPQAAVTEKEAVAPIRFHGPDEFLAEQFGLEPVEFTHLLGGFYECISEEKLNGTEETGLWRFLDDDGAGLEPFFYDKDTKTLILYGKRYLLPFNFKNNVAEWWRVVYGGHVYIGTRAIGESCEYIVFDVSDKRNILFAAMRDDSWATNAGGPVLGLYGEEGSKQLVFLLADGNTFRPYQLTADGFTECTAKGGGRAEMRYTGTYAGEDLAVWPAGAEEAVPFMYPADFIAKEFGMTEVMELSPVEGGFFGLSADFRDDVRTFSRSDGKSVDWLRSFCYNIDRGEITLWNQTFGGLPYFDPGSKWWTFSHDGRKYLCLLTSSPTRQQMYVVLDITERNNVRFGWMDDYSGLVNACPLIGIYPPGSGRLVFLVGSGSDEFSVFTFGEGGLSPLLRPDGKRYTLRYRYDWRGTYDLEILSRPESSL